MYLRLLVGQRLATSAREVYALAENAARRAVALDDSLAEAHAALGDVLMAGYDLAAAEKELKRAATIDPVDSRTRRSLATLDYWKERPADALAEANLAAENDPLSPSAHAEVAMALCANRESTQGLARLKRVESVQPPLLRVPLYAGLCHAMKQDWMAAVMAMRQSQEYRGRGFLGYALARGHLQTQAVAILSDLTAHAQRTNQGAFEVAVVYAGLGDRDHAFEWLDRSIDDLSLSPNIMLPLFDELHSDTRFERFRRELGL
jgi:tetratricopeptide (TPR) repeat protein